MKEKLVACSGAFDIIHAGHIKFLEEARKQGDKLKVFLNSDNSVKKLKGKDRPINNHINRKIVLKALRCVDEVFIFYGDNPCGLIEFVKPDVYVNGEEYGKNCLEKKVVKTYGGKVYIVKNYKGLSTTNILKNKIKLN